MAWNAGDDLPACLDALHDSAGELGLEAIVVDNGSSDSTREVLERREWVRTVFNERNHGLTVGRNQALSISRGRIAVMLDADTVPLPNSIRKLVTYLDGRPGVGLVAPKLLNSDGSLQLSCRRVPPARMPLIRRPPLSRWFEDSSAVDRHLMRDYDHRHARAVDWVMGACQCFRTELVDALGGYDERIFFQGGEDRDWCLRMWKHGLEVHYYPGAEMVHGYSHYTRDHPFSKQAVRAFTDFYYGYWKHRDVRHGVAPE